MEIDGRDSAKCRKSKLGDIDDIIEFVLNEKKKTKLRIVLSSPNKKIPKWAEGGGLDSRCRFLIFFRERATSL